MTLLVQSSRTAFSVWRKLCIDTSHRFGVNDDGAGLQGEGTTVRLPLGSPSSDDHASWNANKVCRMVSQAKFARGCQIRCANT